MDIPTQSLREKRALYLRQLSTQEPDDYFIVLLETAMQENFVNNKGALSGRTALHVAVIHENIPVIDLLRRAGADALLTDNSGKTALQYTTPGSKTHDALTKNIMICPNNPLCQMPCEPEVGVGVSAHKV